MQVPGHKTKQYTLVLFKITMLIAAAWMIYIKLVPTEDFSPLQSLSTQNIERLLDPVVLCLLLAFSAANWFFEIIKWQALLVDKFSVSLKTAAHQVLASHTTALLTPARAGEYVAKALFFKKSQYKTILKLNAVGNIYQMAITIGFGMAGAGITINNYFPEYLSIYGFTITGIVTVILLFKFSPNLFEKKHNRLFSNLFFAQKLKTVGIYSLLRYLIFSHQFYFLLWLFGVEASYFTLMAIISLMYLISSFLPVIQLFDVVIKGSVALFLFEFIKADSTVILAITLLMWLFNFGIPALTGGVLLIIPKAVEEEPKLSVL